MRDYQDQRVSFAYCIVLIAFVAVTFGIGIFFAKEKENGDAEQLKSYLRLSPKVYLDGVEVDPGTLMIDKYLYEYDEESNILKLTGKLGN